MICDGASLFYFFSSSSFPRGSVAILPNFRARNPEEASRSSRSSVPGSSVTSRMEQSAYACVRRVREGSKERKREKRRGRETRSETSREGTSERQRGSHGGELVGLAVCCPMTEFIASFAFAPKSRSFDVTGRVARRDSLFH